MAKGKTRRISVNGVEYPSIKAAAKAYGVSGPAVRAKANSTNNKTWFFLEEPRSLLKVKINDIVYVSIAAASKANGLTPTGVIYRVNSPNFPNWKTVKGQRISDRCLVPPRLIGKHGSPMPVSIDGVVFKSLTAAGKKYNMTISSIVHRCSSKNFPSWFLVN